VRTQTLGLSAGTTGELTSQSHPANVELALGQFVTVDGYVDAELGGVSANTRVTVSFFSGKTFIFEAQTDAAGYYSFVGIPSNISLGPVNFYAADGTLGAHKDNIAVGTAAVHLPRVRLDSTPPTAARRRSRSSIATRAIRSPAATCRWPSPPIRPTRRRSTSRRRAWPSRRGRSTA